MNTSVYCTVSAKNIRSSQSIFHKKIQKTIAQGTRQKHRHCLAITFRSLISVTLHKKYLNLLSFLVEMKTFSIKLKKTRIAASMPSNSDVNHPPSHDFRLLENQKNLSCIFKSDILLIHLLNLIKV